ncbi:M28 family peptidase [Massilia sp. DD77]|uniref:M28 family peptidase n=1 Tax=Massilia sp. DD77 TaxID=3109349 RepID=UPI002FFD6AAA
MEGTVPPVVPSAIPSVVPLSRLARARPLAGLLPSLAACLALAILAWIALAPVPIPAPVLPEPARWQARAMEHVTALSVAPRPIATAANGRARDYILEQLRAMGYAPEIQRTTVRRSVLQFGVHTSIGVVNNIVLRIPGHRQDRLRRPALLLTAHYDSGAATLGAARAAAPVAALLETARALRREGPSANDIVLLFADGEHVGGLGAKGFVDQHPLSRHIGLALRFDSAGSGGPLRLFAASGAGKDALRGWARATPDVGGTSLAAALMPPMPQHPDIGPLAELDAPVLLFANTEKRFDRERANDVPARLEHATLLHMGDAMLRLTREFGDATLARGRHPGHAWFALPGLGPVHHSPDLAWGAARVALLLLLGACVLSFRQLGAVPAVQGLFGAALLLVAARTAVWWQRESLWAAALADDHNAALAAGAFVAIGFLAALLLVRRVAGQAAAVLGPMAWALAALVLLLSLRPGAGYLYAWPLLGMLAAYLVLASSWAPARVPAVRALVLLAGLAPAALLLPPGLREVWTSLAPHGLYVAAVLVALPMLCFAAPLLMLRAPHALTAALALALALGFALPRTTAAPTPAESTPPPNRLTYLKDMNTWRAYWLMPPQPLDAWTRQVFPDQREPAIYVDAFGWNSPRQWHAVAPRDDALSFPETYLLRSTVMRNGEGRVRYGRFTVRSKNKAPHIEMWVSGTKPLRSRLDGRPLTSTEGPWWVSLYGMEDRTMEFEIEAKPEDIFAVTVEERIPGLPEHLLPPRPVDAPPLLPDTGTTVSKDILRFY